MNFDEIDKHLIISYEQLRINLKLKKKILKKLQKRLECKSKQTYITDF